MRWNFKPRSLTVERPNKLGLPATSPGSPGLPRHKVPPITAILRPNLGILRTTGTAQTQQINWMQYVQQYQSFEYFEYWYWWYFLNIGTVVSMVLIFDIDDILIFNIIHPLLCTNWSYLNEIPQRLADPPPPPAALFQTSRQARFCLGAILPWRLRSKCDFSGLK